MVERYSIAADALKGSTLKANRTLSFAQWNPPLDHMVKVNVDAAVWEGSAIGIGWVIRDHRGEIRAAGAKKLSVCWDAYMAEFAAARMGVVKASQLGFKRVVIESDLLSVISALHNKTDFRNFIFLFLDDIRNLLPYFDVLLASHVKRGGNCLAHYLARLGPSDGSDLMYCDNFSKDILDLAELDLME